MAVALPGSVRFLAVSPNLFMVLQTAKFSSGDWPEDPDIIKAIDADFSGLWGDRRQEIVFIGEKVNQEALNEAFDHCLLTSAEMRTWEKVMQSERYTHDQVVDKLNMKFEGGPLRIPTWSDC